MAEPQDRKENKLIKPNQSNNNDKYFTPGIVLNLGANQNRRIANHKERDREREKIRASSAGFMEGMNTYEYGRLKNVWSRKHALVVLYGW